MSSELMQIHERLRRGDLSGAVELCRAALTGNPFNAPVLDLMGVAVRGQGDALQAVEHFRNAISLEPEMALYRCHLALAYRTLGRTDDARAAFEEALARDPSSFEAAYNYSQFLGDLGEGDAAVDLARTASRLEPKLAAAHNNLAVWLQSTGRYEEAAGEYRQAIRFDPDHRNAHANLANVLAESDRIEDAMKLLDRALAKWPRDADLLNARANAFLRRNALERAVAACDAVLDVDPTYAQAHYTKGMALLMQGRFETGFKEYDWRVRRAGFAPRRAYNRPRWTGEPMAGKTLLVHWEQGFGDVIQFCRYLPMLRAFFDATPIHAGARIIVDCQRPLIGLIETVGGMDEIGDFGSAPPAFDAYVPMMSLPGILGTTPDTIPAAVPYLRAGAADDVSFGDATEGTLKIGFTWASRHGETLRRKVMSPRDFAPLFELKGCRFYALQYGHDGKALGPYLASCKVGDLSGAMGDFARNAALVAKLDLVVSIDTYIVHLAGALAKPVWTMLPFSPDWRWGLERSDCPWYPTMRLFRQSKPGDWKSVVAEVARALAAFRAA